MPPPNAQKRGGANMSFAPPPPNTTWALLKHDGLFGPRAQNLTLKKSDYPTDCKTRQPFWSKGPKRLSCFKRAPHRTEKMTDRGPLSAIEGPFKQTKGLIYPTEALFLNRMTLHWPDKALCLNRLKMALFRSKRALFRSSCFKRTFHRPEKTDGGPLSALEDPFEPIKGSIQLTEAVCLERPSVGLIRPCV